MGIPFVVDQGYVSKGMTGVSLSSILSCLQGEHYER